MNLATLGTGKQVQVGLLASLDAELGDPKEKLKKKQGKDYSSLTVTVTDLQFMTAMAAMIVSTMILQFLQFSIMTDLTFPSMTTWVFWHLINAY